MKVWQTRSKLSKIMALSSPFAYLLFFVLFETQLGTVANLLGIVPLLVLGYVYGWRGGALGGAFVSIAISLIRLLTFDEVVVVTTSALSAIIGAGAGSIIGLLNDQQAALQIARKEAVDANNFKTLFMASMTHELRTPLNAILNFSEILSLGMLGSVNDEQKDLLEQTTESGQYLLTMINDILDMSKIQAGMFSLLLEDNVDFNKEVDASIAIVQTLLRNKPVQLIADVDKNLPSIRADKRRIRQILINLLSNAAKFTDEGTVTLSIKQEGQNLLIVVMDTGLGISEEDQELVFEPYSQSESGISHTGGTGLGLPITREIVLAHDGRIWIESELGGGAAFYVELPVFSNNS